MLLVIYFDDFFKDIIQQLDKNSISHVKLKYSAIKSQTHFENILSKNNYYACNNIGVAPKNNASFT